MTPSSSEMNTNDSYYRQNGEGNNDEKDPLLITFPSDDDDDNPNNNQGEKKSNLFIAILVFSFIILSIVSTVGRKLVLDSFGQHLAFFRQILGVFMYDVWCSLIVGYKLWRTNDIPFSIRQANPIYFFAGIGLLDGFGDFLSSVGGVHSPGSLQTLLGQLVIPFTLVIAYFLTKTKFSWVQILGAVVVIGGVCVATIPEIKSDRSGDAHHDHKKKTDSSSAEGEQTYWYSIVVFAASQIPQAASVVCKEFLFKRSKGKLDVFYLSCLVSWTQLFLIWIFVPLQSFKALGGVPLDEIGDVMTDGARCFIGEDVPQNRPAVNWTAVDLGLVNESSIERCQGSYVTGLTFAYSICGFLQGILQLLIVKYHSAALAILCNAIVLPLSNLAYSVPAFVGGTDKAEKFSVFDVIGLLVTVLGLVVYQSKALREQFCPSDDKRNIKINNQDIVIEDESEDGGNY